MGETSSQNPPATGITPGISPSVLKKAVVVVPHHSSTSYDEKHSGDFVVRLPRTQATISVKLDTKAMIEQRETERANDAMRKW